MDDGPKFVPVTIESKTWIEWSKQWPEDLREDAKAFVAKWRRLGIGETDLERAFNAFLAYRSLAPPELGGPQHDGPQDMPLVWPPPTPKPEDPDWSEL